RAFAVCDHQLAHVYVARADDRERVRAVIAATPGVGRVLEDAERTELGLDHPRAGELIALARHDSWFAYPYWLHDRRAPDFARTAAQPGAGDSRSPGGWIGLPTSFGGRQN